MKKVLLILAFFILTGCTLFDKPIEKYHLDDKYYSDGKYIEVESLDDIDSNAYIIFTYNNYCNLSIPCEQIFKEFMDKYKIDIISIPFEKYKSTTFYKKVKYAPSVLLIKDNKIIAYLDAEKDEDIEKYQDSNAFEEWIEKYIYLTK